VITIVGRENATAAWSFSNINVLQCLPLRSIVQQLGGNGSYHLWIRSKTAENRNKTLLTIKLH
jgi:hypothetical protein